MKIIHEYITRFPNKATRIVQVKASEDTWQYKCPGMSCGPDISVPGRMLLTTTNAAKKPDKANRRKQPKIFFFFKQNCLFI